MEQKHDQELLAEAYSKIIIKEGDMDSHLGIASGGYQQEARPEDNPTNKSTSLDEHIKGIKNWLNNVEKAHANGNDNLAMKMLKNIAQAISTI